MSWSTRSGQFGFITTDMAPVCFDNLPHCEPLPGYALPHTPLGSLQRYKDDGTKHFCCHYLYKPACPHSETFSLRVRHTSEPDSPLMVPHAGDTL